MENNQPDKSVRVSETDPVQANSLEAKQTEDGWIIRRPKRAKLTAEESLRRTQEFVDTKGERFIASFRKSKS